MDSTASHVQDHDHPDVLINVEVDVADGNAHDSQMITQDISDDEADDTIQGTFLILVEAFF